jgi:cytochrome c553
MMRRAQSFLVFCCIISFLACGLIMAEGKGNDKKGKFYFKKTCKTCHAKDGEGGEVTPMDKTQSQWERYFVKDEHKDGAESLESVAPADQLVHIQTFLVNHAADSDQPETCG